MFIILFSICRADVCDKHQNDIITYKTTDVIFGDQRIHYSDKTTIEEENMNIDISDQCTYTKSMLQPVSVST